MLNDAEKNEIINFIGIYSLFMAVSGGWIFFLPFFKGDDFVAFALLLAFQLALLVSGAVFFYRFSSKLSVFFLLWRGGIAILLWFYSISIIHHIWFKNGGRLEGFLIILTWAVSLLASGWILRLLEPSSNYKSGVKRGRYKVGKFEFKAEIWRQDITNDNPVLRLFGFGSNKSCKRKTFIKLVLLLLIVTSLFYVVKFSGELFILQVYVIYLNTISLGYILTFNYLSDLYFCLKAGFQKNKS